MSDETKEPTQGQAAPEPVQTPAADSAPEVKPGTEPEAGGPAENKEPAAPKSILEEEDEAEGEGKPQETPEQYDEFKLPEGFQQDGPMLEAFVPLAKEAGLPQELAQKFVDLGTKLVEKATADSLAAWQETTGKWATEIKADPEFGGAKLKESRASVVRAIQAFGDPETQKYLTESKIINHPGLYRMLARAGKTVSEDKVFDGGPAQTEQSAAKTLYPTWA